MPSYFKLTHSTSTAVVNVQVHICNIDIMYFVCVQIIDVCVFMDQESSCACIILQKCSSVLINDHQLIPYPFYRSLKEFSKN